MVGTTGKVRRTVKIDETKVRGNSVEIVGSHEETVDDAAIVVGQREGKLCVLVFSEAGIAGPREVDPDDFHAPDPAAHPDLVVDRP
jgi:hypothetical protein